ncbi:MAG: hypothetical protein IT353_09735 [Gemmatimonadaceae bacterium]|nr:hypothetical protein [Gemmatimonadaceae bacterium]
MGLLASIVVVGASAVAAQATVPAATGRGALTISALETLIADASRRNQLPPPLVAYRADVETEVGVLFRRQDQSEWAMSLEQVVSTLRWTRAGTNDQQVIGHREQQQTFATSMLSVYQAGWLVPVLYGNRLRLRSFFDTAATAVDSAKNHGGIPAVHPLAEDRASFYTYSGGDTVVIITSGARRVPIVRVHVHPRRDVRSPVLLFEGDLDLDIARGALVRMHGYFLSAGVARVLRQAARVLAAYAFVEFENAEYLGEYWLPFKQRIELQVVAPVLTEQRYVSRIVSRFTRVAVNDTTLDSITLAQADSLRERASRRLRWAPNASLDRFDAWQFPFGAISSGMHADDFGVVGPDFMRPTGAPRLDLSSQHGSDLFRYNRVEGAFTGVGLKLAMRDRAPGVVMRATGGWAWNERTARGRAAIDWTRGGWAIGARVGRSLEMTNDFQRAIEPNLDMFGIDNSIDYVDRRSVGAIATRQLLRGRVLVRADVGAASDRDAPTRLAFGPFGRSPFRANRGVDEGRYTRSAAVVEWNPRAADQGALPGMTARINYQRGDGALAFERVEARAIARRFVGPVMALGRIEGGVVTGGRIPPQRLFELSRGRSLPGYDSSFAGSQAVTMRGSLLYNLPLYRRPYRIFNTFSVPGIAPGLLVSVNGAWTGAPTASARDALLRLGVVTDSLNVSTPVARVTDVPRASVSAGVRLFSGALFIGVARPLGQFGPWRLTLSAAN